MSIPGPPVWVMSDAQRREVLGKAAPAPVVRVRTPPKQEPRPARSYVVPVRLTFITGVLIAACAGWINALIVGLVGWVIVAFCLDD